MSIKSDYFPPRLKIVLPIALLLFCSTLFGFVNGRRAQAYLAYTKHHFDKAFDLFAQAGDNSGCGMVLLAQNYPQSAMDYFYKDNDQSGMGLAYHKMRRYNEALYHFKKAHDQRGIGLSYLAEHDIDKATAAFTEGNDWSGLGLVALAKRNYPKAQFYFNQVDDRRGAGLVALRQRKYKEAMTYFKGAGDDSGIGLTYLATRNYKKAEETFIKSNNFSGLGAVAMLRGRYKLAARYFEEANDKNGLGDLYSQLHEFKKAREMFAEDYNPVKVIQSYRNDYTLKDKNGEALAYAKKALIEGRMVPGILMQMGDIYYEQKKYARAIKALKEAAGYPGYEGEASLHLGRVYFYLREFDKAKEAFNRTLADGFVNAQQERDAKESLAAIGRYESLPEGQLQRIMPAALF